LLLPLVALLLLPLPLLLLCRRRVLLELRRRSPLLERLLGRVERCSFRPSGPAPRWRFRLRDESVRLLRFPKSDHNTII